MKDETQRSEQQDWTPERLRKYINTGPLDLSSLAREINSCIASERQRRERAEAGQVCDIVSVMDESKSLRHQLLSALAAIEKHNQATIDAGLRNWTIRCVDLSALRKHDVEVREPLVEALERLRDCDFVITLPDRMDAVRKIARDALAKVHKKPAQ